ncbi:MAG: anaerobic ribonucleoside-triphosphate reductase activating protein [Atopobiaceae bacterium]|nr:anaerobic ribonucleoside-triphosphate reductase activating protein [Atopobiaceae bacterium]
MLRIAGITPFSTVDWPDKIVCVAFLSGCPWACPYCQNPQLRHIESAAQTEEDLLAFVDRRVGLLDGVVFSGGEPLAQAEVVDVIRAVRDKGFLVGLHTCGAYPERLRAVLPYVSWVGLDVKAPWDLYERMTGSATSAERARQNLDVLLESGVAYETRTTWHPDLLGADDMSRIAYDLAKRGVGTWAVQAYRATGTTGELANKTVYPHDVPTDLPPLFDRYEFRRA